MIASHTSPPAHAMTCRAGMALAAITSFLIIWTTIVRDDGMGVGSFMVILAAAVGAFAGRFRADALARTMLGVAGMQVLLTIAIVTAPSTATVPDGVLKALISGTLFTGLWLLAAVLFRRAARTTP